ncbi:hypothetical protein E2C01_024231 [Portunus trituberculatus]|uniref:Uncharacterized protein n=1 Tax=Portunus trituberculatus TaxID=210409 RepID=A0A5B7E9S6_PORTR|nr:hypothetical protein [Portunus trituberculatus]
MGYNGRPHQGEEEEEGKEEKEEEEEEERLRRKRRRGNYSHSQVFPDSRSGECVTEETIITSRAAHQTEKRRENMTRI